MQLESCSKPLKRRRQPSISWPDPSIWNLKPGAGVIIGLNKQRNCAEPFPRCVAPCAGQGPIVHAPSDNYSTWTGMRALKYIHRGHSTNAPVEGFSLWEDRLDGKPRRLQSSDGSTEFWVSSVEGFPGYFEASIGHFLVNNRARKYRLQGKKDCPRTIEIRFLDSVCFKSECFSLSNGKPQVIFGSDYACVYACMPDIVT